VTITSNAAASPTNVPAHASSPVTLSDPAAVPLSPGNFCCVTWITDKNKSLLYTTEHARMVAALRSLSVGSDKCPGNLNAKK
jgi:hypothetical protein